MTIVTKMRCLQLLLLLGFTSSCVFPVKGPLSFKVKKETGLSVISPIIAGNAEYNFKNLYDHILKPKCLKCHQGEEAKPKNDPIDFSNYEIMMTDRFVPLLRKGEPLRSRLFLEVESGEMPPRFPLEPEEIEYIKRWIELCAPKETPTLAGGCSPDGGPGDDEPGDDEPGDDEPGDDDEPID